LEVPSEEIAEHIRASWATGLNLFVPFTSKLIINRAPCELALRYSLILSCLVVVCEGQHCLDLLRVELGPALAEVHVPLKHGGVQPHKLQGVMHDTCNSANKTARLAKSLRDTSGQAHFGFEEWELRAAEDKPWFDFLCGNHTPNLPMDAFNREFEAYLRRTLGEDIAVMTAEFETQTRVEASGVLLLRSLCKLTRKGHHQYAKGDGHQFHDYLERQWPHTSNGCVGRAEQSKRQDWICEASWNFHNLINPIIDYTVSTLRLGANILRDSVLTRLENLHYEAYVHSNAIMWKVAFEELRALTNKKDLQAVGVGLNPMELNDLYDHLWNMGTLLQGEDALSILYDTYRPWLRVRFSQAPSRSYYAHLEKNKAADRVELKQYEKRPDLDIYLPILVDVPQLWGIAIHTSLECTLGKYLKSTDGIFRNDLREDWELDKVGKLLCTNNPAERPFAVAKGNSSRSIYSY
jgi:hypothetical protein